MPASNEQESNKPLTDADCYRLTYERLLAQLPSALKEKVLDARARDKEAAPEVTHFIKRVIELAEADDK